MANNVDIDTDTRLLDCVGCLQLQRAAHACIIAAAKDNRASRRCKPRQYLFPDSGVLRVRLRKVAPLVAQLPQFQLWLVQQMLC